MIPKTDEHGLLVGFRYHDGALEGVVAEESGTTMRLLIRSSAGEPHTVVLRQVRAFRVDDFRGGNIVHRMLLLSVPQAATSPRICRLLRSRLDINIEALPPEVRVFLVEPSYGAEVIAVVGAVEVDST